MVILEWVFIVAVIVGAFIGAFEVTDALHYDQFAQWMDSRRPRAHKFN